MSCSLELALDRAEGALLRVLGTIERRGWNVLTVNAASDSRSYTVSLTLDGARDPDHRHLAALRQRPDRAPCHRP